MPSANRPSSKSSVSVGVIINSSTSDKRPGALVEGAMDATSANRLRGSSEYVLSVLLSKDADK